MKKLSMLPTLLLILALCTTAALAAPSISLGADISGSADQKETFSDTLNIENDGTDNLTITVSISDLEHVDTGDTISDSQVDITDDSFDLDVGENQDVEFSLTVPDNQELGTYEATITIEYDNGTDTSTETATLTLDVELGNHLIIDRLELSVDGDSQRMSDGEKHDEEAKPRSELTIEITIENDFSDSIEITDIEVFIRGEGDLEWDDDDEMSDLDDGDDDTITFTYDVPEASDIDDDTYEIEIEVRGVDENDNDHGETWTIEVEVDRAKYDLKFQSIDLSPSYLDCGETNMRATIDMENVGSSDINEGTLLITSRAFKDEVIVRNIEVDEGDDVVKTVTLPIKDNLDAGEYFIDLQLFSTSNSDDDTDVTSMTITVLECPDEAAEEEDEEEEDETDIEVVTPEPSVPSGNVVYKASGTPSKSFLGAGSNTYLVLLGVIIVLLIVLIVVAIAALTKK